MKLAEYSPLALRTAKPMETAYLNVWHACVGLVTEVGEIMDAYKKSTIYGKPLDAVNVLEELGDVLWYLNLYGYHKGIDSDLYLVMPSRELSRETVNDAVTDYTCRTGHALLAELLTTVHDMYMSETMSLSPRTPSVCPAKAYGMVLMLVSILALALDSDIGAVMQTNIDKLTKRYGDKYSDYAAVNRDVVAERAVLDAGLESNT